MKMKYFLLLILPLLFLQKVHGQIVISDKDKEIVAISNHAGKIWAHKLERVKGTNFYTFDFFNWEERIKIPLEASEDEMKDLHDFLKYRMTQSQSAVIAIGNIEFTVKGVGEKLLFQYADSPDPYALFELNEESLNDLFSEIIN